MQISNDQLFDKNQLDTPALLLDMDIAEENIRMMAKSCKENSINLRPHFKSHKCSLIALEQIKAGAIGITCAKVGEAEVLVNAGIKDIFIANQIVSENKIERVALLSKRANVMVAVDNEKNIQVLSDIAVSFNATIGIIVEIDVGLNRCGVRTIEEAIVLAKKTLALPGIKLCGIMGYEGHCNKYLEYQKRKEEVVKANNRLIQLKRALEKEKIPVEIVSAGGTCMYDITPLNPDITEIQPGAYVLMGTKWSSLEGIPFKQAETILTTVVSKPQSDTIIIDAGLKAFSTESGNPTVKGDSGIEFFHFSEEHTTLKLTGENMHYEIGDKIELIPSNCNTTTNLYNSIFGIRQNKRDMIIPIDARGRCD